MDWALAATTGDVTATTDARGFHDIVCLSAAPLLRQLVPSLPWQAGPRDNTATIPYAAAASVMWAPFKSLDDSSASSKSLLFSLLKPTVMARALKKLQSLRFDFTTPLDATTAAVKLQNFVSRIDDPDFQLVEADLEKVAPGAVDLVKADYRYTPLHPPLPSFTFISALRIRYISVLQSNVSTARPCNTWYAFLA